MLKLPSGFNTHSSNSVQNLNSAADLNRWPKLFKLSKSVGDCNLYRLVRESEEKFCDKNHSTIQVAKYMRWFNKIISKD